ncbi:hypothetical protein GGI20_000622 [Coemansia sp. BCRC 34301]|nr:hypothetical protein GGI20_000622 [Coemansia sp. BCRC 34301]
MTEPLSTGNSMQLKRKAAHSPVLETGQQGWTNSSVAATTTFSNPLQPPRKRRHATEAMLTGHSRLCSGDLLYGRKTLNDKIVSQTGEANSLNSRKRKGGDSWGDKVSVFDHVPNERDFGAPAAKRSRIDRVEQSMDQVTGAGFSSDEQEDEQVFPKYTVIPLPLSVRAQAYLQCQPQNHQHQSKAPVKQQPASALSCGGSSALILYNPEMNKLVEPVDADQAPGSLAPCSPCPSSGSTMDVD